MMKCQSLVWSVCQLRIDLANQSQPPGQPCPGFLCAMQGNIIPGVTGGTPTRNLQSADTSWFAPVALAQSQRGTIRHNPTSHTGVNLDPLLTPCQQKTPWEFSRGLRLVGLVSQFIPSLPLPHHRRRKRGQKNQLPC